MRKNMTGFFMLVVLCCGSLQADTETLKFVKGIVDFFTGTVKSFNDDEGYGLIEPDNGGADVCVY